MKRGFVDLVIGGPDMSGTSTQVQGLIKYFQKEGKIVRDIRGTEIDALFHTEKFQKELKTFGQEVFLNFEGFLSAVERCQSVSTVTPNDFICYANELLTQGGTNQDLKIVSMVMNEVSTYIDPRSADVWIMEEPTKRGAGQVNRTIEQNRSKYDSSMNPQAAAEAHSVYRTDEFLRFRKPLRKIGKVIIRSRSEESACYQIFDKKVLPKGVDRDYYFNLSGHQVAFANPPNHIFVVCGPKDWNEKNYLELKRERSGKDRLEDDHEKNAAYQVLVNKRYATDWLENLYSEGCKKWGGKAPQIHRFDIYETKYGLVNQMITKLESIIK